MLITKVTNLELKLFIFNVNFHHSCYFTIHSYSAYSYLQLHTFIT